MLKIWIFSLETIIRILHSSKNIKHLRHIIFTTLILIVFNSLAQKKNITNQVNDYYIQQWNKNLVSLINDDSNSLVSSAAFVEHNLLSISDFKYDKYISNIDSDIELKYDTRVGEILNNYIQNGKNTGKALSYSHFLAVDFETALKEAKLPITLKYLPFALSAMNNLAVEKTGAAGLWQLRYSAARKEGLNIDSYVDERRDIKKATTAAVSELKQLYQIYKNWDLAIAAYTCGASNVNKSILRSNNQMSYDSIYTLLPDFGKDIIPALTASVILHNFADSLNICNNNISFEIDIDTLEVSQQLHLKQLNGVLGISMDTLTFLNPQYKQDIIPAVSEVYNVIIPKHYLAKFNELEDSVYKFQDSLLFDISKPVILPPPSKNRHYAKYEPEQVPDGSAKIIYTIKSGDNLGYISSWFDVKVRQIEDWNNIYDPRRIRAGKKIKIYVDLEKKSYYKKLETMSFSQKQKREGKTVKAKSTKKAEPLGKDWFYHTVKSGESPSVIAGKYKNVSTDDILRWNNIKDARSIQIGQKLKIKKK